MLRSMDPVKVAAFLKERELYEIEVGEKRKEIPTLTVAPYTVSVDRTLLKNMCFLRRFENIAPGLTYDKLTSNHIRTFIENIVKKDVTNFDHNIVEKALSGLRMTMHIFDPEARVLHFVNDFFERLDGIGYGTFKEKNPKKPLSSCTIRCTPRNQKAVMGQNVEYREELKTNVPLYVSVLCQEATSQCKVPG